jgi:hypothetical protein
MQAVREILLMLTVRKRYLERRVRQVDATKRPEDHRDLVLLLDDATNLWNLARAIYRLELIRNPAVEPERKRVVALSGERNEFVTFTDGYVHYWPAGSPNGALSSWHLRVLADELDRRNRAWDVKVRRALSRRPSAH